MTIKSSDIYSQLVWLSVVGLTTLAVFIESRSHNEAMSSVMSADPPRVNCSTLPEARQPGNILNSRYFLWANGSICCPRKNCQYSDDAIQDICGIRGTVNEPCYDCRTCGRLKGESCHGIQFSNGECGPGLSCINVNGTILEFDYDEGVCTNAGGPPRSLMPSEACGGKFGYLGTCEPQSRCNLEPGKIVGKCVKYARTKTIYRACGGSYGILGRCIEGLLCTVDENLFLNGDGSRGICLNSGFAVCFKDCSKRAAVRVCGDNGQWYENICYLRQSNCFPDPDRRRKVRKTTDTSICGSTTTGTQATATSAPSISLM